MQKHLPIGWYECSKWILFLGYYLTQRICHTHHGWDKNTPTAEDFGNLHSLESQNLKMIFPVEDDILHFKNRIRWWYFRPNMTFSTPLLWWLYFWWKVIFSWITRSADDISYRRCLPAPLTWRFLPPCASLGRYILFLNIKDYVHSWINIVLNVLTKV